MQHCRTKPVFREFSKSRINDSNFDPRTPNSAHPETQEYLKARRLEGVRASGESLATASLEPRSPPSPDYHQKAEPLYTARMKDSFRQEMLTLEGEHWWYRARRSILERALARFIGPTQRGLTAGVGAREEAELLSRFTNLVAIDIAPMDPAFNVHGLATQADAARLPFADSSFDAVFLFDVLEHIEDDRRALSEFHRVLTEQGKILLTVPAFMFMYGLQDEISGHHRRYRRTALGQLLRESGFRVSYLGYFNSFLFPPIAAIRGLRKIVPTRRTPRGSGGDFDMRLPSILEKTLETLFRAERHAIPNWELPVGVSLMAYADRIN